MLYKPMRTEICAVKIIKNGLFSPCVTLEQCLMLNKISGKSSRMSSLVF